MATAKKRSVDWPIENLEQVLVVKGNAVVELWP
jgi:hypothetical protein